MNLGTDERVLQGIFDEKVTQDNLRKHCLASQAIMRRLAVHFGEDADLWGWAGLLHDLDFEETKDEPNRHGLVAAQWLEDLGVNTELITAIKAHNAEALRLQRVSRLDYALTCAETVTGLIVATALILPDKKLSSVKASSVRKRMKQTAFARNVQRENILLCEKIGLDLEAFINLSLEAMQSIAEELGL